MKSNTACSNLTGITFYQRICFLKSCSKLSIEIEKFVIFAVNNLLNRNLNINLAVDKFRKEAEINTVFCALLDCLRSTDSILLSFIFVRIKHISGFKSITRIIASQFNPTITVSITLSILLWLSKCNSRPIVLFVKGYNFTFTISTLYNALIIDIISIHVGAEFDILNIRPVSVFCIGISRIFNCLLQFDIQHQIIVRLYLTVDQPLLSHSNAVFPSYIGVNQIRFCNSG